MFPLVLLLFDIDHFKSVDDNPTLGTLGGDYVLKELADVISITWLERVIFLPRTGRRGVFFIAFRWGIKQARDISERIRATIVHKFVFNGSSTPLLSLLV